jgi:hypothetical protein
MISPGITLCYLTAPGCCIFHYHDQANPRMMTQAPPFRIGEPNRAGNHLIPRYSAGIEHFYIYLSVTLLIKDRFSRARYG